jgi:hypothetical protein
MPPRTAGRRLMMPTKIQSRDAERVWWEWQISSQLRERHLAR